MNQLVTFLTDERREQGSTISEILLANHPIFARLRQVTNTPYPIFFRTFDDMNALLKARKWKPVEPDKLDSPDHAEWIKSEPGSSLSELLKIAVQVFEDGKLRIYTMDEWNDEWVALSLCDPRSDGPVDEEVPF